MVRPYPHQCLPKVSCAVVAIIDELHRLSDFWEALERAFNEILPVDVSSELLYLGASRGTSSAPGSMAGWWCSLTDASGDEAGCFHLDSALAQALAELVLTGEVPGQLELRPLLAIEQEVLQVLLAHLLARIGTPFQVQSLSKAALGKRDGSLPGCIRLRLFIEELSGVSTLWVEPKRWAESIGRLGYGFERVGRWEGSGLVRVFRRTVRVRLGQFVREGRTTGWLGTGDVLLPKAFRQGVLPNQGQLMIGARPIARVALRWEDAIAFWLPEQHGSQGDTMDNSYDDTADLYGADTLENLTPTIETRPMVLDLVVGRLDMSLGEIIGLKPGRVITISPRVDSPIELQHQGRIVGTGELVEVQGRLGVRILSISPEFGSSGGREP